MVSFSRKLNGNNISYMRNCIACKGQLKEVDASYCQCLRCGTYTYVSQLSAEKENNKYFNDIYLKVEKFEVDGVKKAIFDRFSAIDRTLRKEEYQLFEQAREGVFSLMSTSGKFLEIGFGEGENLSHLLKKGVDAEGVDISEEALKKFQKNFPEYSSKVSLVINPKKRYDFVYCSAIFEHLDAVRIFLKEIYDVLDMDGVLVLDSLPMLNEGSADFDKDSDICFWKPCHRAVYSMFGLQMLFNDAGYIIERSASLDNFNYRLLSLFLKNHYNYTEYLRNPIIKNKMLPGRIQTYLLCRRALKVHSLARQSMLVLKKNVNK